MRTERQIVEQTNEVARSIYLRMGYKVPVDHKFYEFDRVNYHPHEQMCWDSACEAQIIITKTDPNDALDNLGD